MATNKNAFIRYKVLDRCFRNTARRYYLKDLLEACNQALYDYNGGGSSIQRRQLFEDIRFMESEAGWSIPLDRIRDGRRTYYRYSDPAFSIDNQPLNEAEINQLQAALQVLTRLEGLPQFDWLEAIIPRLKSGFEPDRISPILAFDENRYLKGRNWIGELFHAILYKTSLEITYQDFKSEEPYPLTVFPYFLKEYNNRWYLFAKNTESELPVWALALDRIHQITPSPIPYRENHIIDWNEHFEDIIGITIPEDGTVQKIILWVHPESAPYVATKPLHGSQKKLRQTEEGTIYELRVIPNIEFFQRILSFGDKIRILEPAEVVEEIVGILGRALAGYGV